MYPALTSSLKEVKTLFEEALTFCLYALGISFLTIAFKVLWETVKA